MIELDVSTVSIQLFSGGVAWAHVMFFFLVVIVLPVFKVFDF